MKSLFTTAFMALFGVYALVHLGWIEPSEKVTTTAADNPPPKAVLADAGSFTERIAMAVKPEGNGNHYRLRAMR